MPGRIGKDETEDLGLADTPVGAEEGGTAGDAAAAVLNDHRAEEADPLEFFATTFQ
jgi:hypothetical protein